MEPFDATLRFIARVRRELAAVARGETFYATLVALIVTGVIGLTIAALLGVGAGRWAWLVFAVGLGAVGYVVWRFGIVPGRQRRIDAELARWVEARVPDLNSGLVTSVEVAALLKRSDPTTLGFSPKLATETAERTAAFLSALSPASLPNRQALGRLRWMAVGAAVFAGALVILNPTMWAVGATNLVAAPPYEGTEDERLVDVAVSQLELEITPPTYTGLEKRRLPRSSGDVEALSGSVVRFTTTALQPITGAVLVLQSSPEARWQLEVESDGTIRGGFQVGQSDKFQFIVTEPSGRRLRERVWRTVTAVPDRVPEVTLLLPEQDLEVKPTDTIQFFYESSDDLGIDRVELVVADDMGSELSRKPVSQAKGNRIDKGNSAVEVGTMGLEPGQAVDVHFEVFDLAAPTANVGKSQARRIQLYSPQDEHDKLLSRIEEVIEAMLDVLAERLESPLNAQQPERIDEFVTLHTKIGEATRGIELELEEIAQALTTDSLVTDQMRDGVRAVLSSIHDVSEQEQAHIKKWLLDPEMTNQQVLVALLDQTNDEATTVFEQGILKLKKLMDTALKESIMEAGRELLDTQNEIMELMKKLKDSKDPAAREALMKKLRQLQEKMAKLQQQLARAQDRAPYENQNAAQRPNENQQNVASMQDKMDQIQKLLEEGKIDEAMKLMEEMAKSTQELMAALEDDLPGGGSNMSPQARQKMQEFQQQLDEAADGQRGLQKETNSLDKQMEQRQNQEMAEKAKQKAQELRDKAKEIKDALAQTPKDSLKPDDLKAVEQLEQAAKDIEQALENGQLDDVGQKAKSLGSDAENAKNEVAQSQIREQDRKKSQSLEQGMEQLGKASEAAKELAEMIADLKGKPGEGMTPGEGKQMSELGDRQGQLGQKLQGLKQKLGEMEQQFPGISDEIGKKLDEAGQKMGEAEQELDGNSPGTAEERQQEALENLQQAQQQMQEKMKQQQSGSQNEDSSGVNNPKAKVEIPKEDPYARPRKLREEILRMMDEQAPDKYRDAIRKFYEDLTK